MAEDERAIEALIEAVNRAWLEGRYDDVAPYVHEQVVLAPPGDAEPVVGRAAFVQSYADFGAAATVHAFEAGAPRIDRWGGTAVARCPFNIDYEIPSGRYRERGVDLLVLAESDGGWRICWRTVSSAPVEGSE
jgi:ketosteroid isomerase-like protein